MMTIAAPTSVINAIIAAGCSPGCSGVEWLTPGRCPRTAMPVMTSRTTRAIARPVAPLLPGMTPSWHVDLAYGEGMIRTRAVDACPSALSLHRAADGSLARVRLPGGIITATQLSALAWAANEFGSPAMELTSRGNIQIRGITDESAV